jgi:biopolymer transport protein ExbD
MDFTSPRKVNRMQTDMTPMIDVVFQLLVFFLFTFKIAPVEGEIGVHMPPITAGSAADTSEVATEKVPIRLRAGAGGRLETIELGERLLGGGESGLTQLAQTLRDTYGGPNAQPGEVEVEIDADRPLQYVWVIRATNAVMSAGIDAINFRDPKLSPSARSNVPTDP